jgi:hypothetical protein
MTAHAPALTTSWRALYTVATAVAFLTAGYGNSGWVGLALGAGPAKFAVPSIAFALLVAGRLLYVWRSPVVLTWPTSTPLRGIAKVALVASLVGVAGFFALIAAGWLMSGLEDDVRGGAGLVVGLVMLPFIGLGPLGVVVFEWARGWSARAKVPVEDRGLLAIAAFIGALLALAPVILSTMFPADSLMHSWIVFALALGTLVFRGSRGGPFPASAVFATTLTASVSAVVATMFLPWFRESGAIVLVQGNGLLSNCAGFALVLAAVPAVALTLLGRVSAEPSRSWGTRGLLAVPLVLAVAWFGVSTGKDVPLSTAAYLREPVLSDETLAAQAAHLERLCPEAGTQVFRTETDVSQIEIRSSAERRVGQMSHLTVDPTASPQHWFPRRDRGRPYELVVIVLGQERAAYALDPRAAGGSGRAPLNDDVQPRYVLTTVNFHTPQEEADGIVGNEMTIVDTQDNSMLARRVLFFKQRNNRYGGFEEACGTLGNLPYIPDAYAYQWVSTILIPKPPP